MDSFFGIGVMELAFIAILALIILGPERLPGAARETAKILAQIRALSSEFTSQFSEELKMLDEINPKKLVDDIVKDTMNPPKKPAPKSALPSTQNKAAASSSSAKSTASPAGEGEAAAPSGAEPENSILPPTLEETTTGASMQNGVHKAPLAPADTGSDSTAEQNDLPPTGQEETTSTDNGDQPA